MIILILTVSAVFVVVLICSLAAHFIQKHLRDYVLDPCSGHHHIALTSLTAQRIERTCLDCGAVFTDMRGNHGQDLNLHIQYPSKSVES